MTIPFVGILCFPQAKLRRQHFISYPFYSSDGTFFKAGTAVQAVVLPYLIWLRLTLVDAALGTDSQAFSAAYAFIRYSVALKSCAVISDSVGLTEYGIYAKIKIFYGSVLYLKAYADIPLVTRIKILKKRIFGKYGVDAFFLPLLRNGICLKDVSSRYISCRQVSEHVRRQEALL